MLALLKLGKYELKVKAQPIGKAIIAYPVDESGNVGTGPIYEYTPLYNNWWIRRGFSVAC